MIIDGKDYNDMTAEQKEQARRLVLQRLHLTEQEWQIATRTLEVSYLFLTMTNDLSEQAFEIFSKSNRLLGPVHRYLVQAGKAFYLFHRELARCVTDGSDFCKEYEGLARIVCDYISHPEEVQQPETRLRELRQDLEEMKRREWQRRKGLI